LYGSLIHVRSGNINRQKGRIRSLLRNAGIRVLKMSDIEPTLEDVFISRLRSE
jgi:hypothetical protein